MHELAFPSSVSNEFGLDLFQWLRELRLQKIVANFANGFLSPAAIEFLGAMVPKVNSTLYAASHDAVVYELKKILWMLQHRHRLMQCTLWLFVLTQGALCMPPGIIGARVDLN